MRNDKFWDECSTDSIRYDVAVFMDNNSILCKLKGDNYYLVEDAIVGFIEEHKEKIAKERNEREILREEILEYLHPSLRNIIPMNFLHKLESLSEIQPNEEDIRDVIFNMFGLDKLEEIKDTSDEDIKCYIAYLYDWFENYTPLSGADPVCIDEFVDCELEDNRQKYLKIARKIFNK